MKTNNVLVSTAPLAGLGCCVQCRPTGRRCSRLKLVQDGLSDLQQGGEMPDGCLLTVGISIYIRVFNIFSFRDIFAINS